MSITGYTSFFPWVYILFPGYASCFLGLHLFSRFTSFFLGLHLHQPTSSHLNHLISMPSCNIDQVFNEGRHDDGENWLVSTDYDQERTSLMVKQ